MPAIPAPHPKPTSALKLGAGVIALTIGLIAVFGLGNPWGEGFANVPALTGAWGSHATRDSKGADGHWLIRCARADACLRRAAYVCRDGFAEVPNDRIIAPLKFSASWGRGTARTHYSQHIFIACPPQ